MAIALVDRIGRKPLLVIGSAGMAITLALMALCLAEAAGAGTNLSLPAPWGPTALIAANLHVVFFGESWGRVVWVLLGEMFPNRIRAMALAVAAAAQWLANFSITSSFPVKAQFSLPFACAVYAAFAEISLVFVLKFVGGRGAWNWRTCQADRNRRGSPRLARMPVSRPQPRQVVPRVPSASSRTPRCWRMRKAPSIRAARRPKPCWRARSNSTPFSPPAT